MEEDDVVKSLAAMAHPARLRVFRALVVAGPAGLTPGVLSGQLGLAPTALSFHLKELSQAALVSSERDGRHLIYRAAFARMNALLTYLTANCCEGSACPEATAPGCTTC